MNDTSDNSTENMHQSTERIGSVEESQSDHTRVDTRINFPDITDLEIHQIIGKGGSGIVYKGRQLFLERDVAIKLLNVNQEDQAFFKHFQREAQILAKLSHHNIVSCYQAGMTNESLGYRTSPYIAMEFINGPSLCGWISKKGKLSSLLALDITIHIANALSYALKQGIIHRDVKAENILLKPFQDQEQIYIEPGSFQFVPKLADLGIARTYHDDRVDDLTLAGFIVGTPSSMAPEQFNEPDKVDFKADIYGLGCVLFHMLTGEKPYKGETLTGLIVRKNSENEMNPRELAPELDKNLAMLVTSMMAKDKQNRPAYEDVIQQCQKISDHLKQAGPQKNSSRLITLN